MLDFIIFLLSTFGLTMIITNSFLFKNIRNYMSKYKYLGKLFSCTQCMGFWSGLIVFFLMKYEINFILYGFMGSIFCYSIWLFLKKFIDKYD